MKTMYKFFQLHDVSNRTQHIQKRDKDTEPYTNINDSRLCWLNEEFPLYIQNIQLTSERAGMAGLTKETAEALVFTSKSSYMCIRYLIEDLKFYYVLTRSFSSDAVETLFSNIRHRGGSNDLIYCRAADHAIKQILKSGLINSVNSGNAMANVEYTSQTTFESFENSGGQDDKINVVISDELFEKLQTLSTFEDGLGNSNIESAAMAFLCGYLIMKVENISNCGYCLVTLRNLTPSKTNALLELISNQNRGKLNYPSQKFVALITFVITLILELLPNLPRFHNWRNR